MTEKENEEEAKEVKEVKKVKSKKKGKGFGQEVLVWQGITAVAIVLLIISIFTGGFNLKSGAVLSKEEAGKKAVDFINSNLMQPGMEVTLVGVEEMANLFKIILKVRGDDFESYISKDGEVLFPQGYVIKEVVAELGGAEAEVTGMVKTDKPNIKMFVMTFCPFGQQAEKGLGPALEKLGGVVEFEPHFVIYEKYCSNIAGRMGMSVEECTPQYCFDKEQKYCSMHGIGELNEGLRQLCVWNDDKEKWWDYVNQINERCSYGNVDSCWIGVAKETGVDVNKVEGCVKEKAELFLKREVLLNKKYGVRGSPMVFINDVQYSGARAPEAYKQGICAAFNTKPEVCGETLSSTGAGAEGQC